MNIFFAYYASKIKNPDKADRQLKKSGVLFYILYVFIFMMLSYYFQILYTKPNFLIGHIVCLILWLISAIIINIKLKKSEK